MEDSDSLPRPSCRRRPRVARVAQETFSVGFRYGRGSMADASPAPLFGKILCAVDSSPQSVEATRQAIALAGPASELHFVTVSQTVRQRFGSSPDPSEESFQKALEESVGLAKEAGISASSEIFNALYTADVLLPESRNHDLLVIGSPDRSRAVGIALAATASRLVHDAGGAVLVARQAPGEADFPKNVLLASDGATESWPPAKVASGLAEAFNARVEVVNVSDQLSPEQRRALEDQLAAVGEASGEKPRLVEAEGRVVQAIVEMAEQEGASLIVTGHRGLGGLRALASVSERVVHTAPCSVLLIPDGGDDELAA
jgi:nucleotide-binding universal stress UspA family protein